MNKLYKCYSRLLIDNHITDCLPEYMSRFSPEEYVRLVKLSGVEASMVYACCHNGNCYYPTKVGHQHANLHGRDVFGETVRLLRQEGIVPLGYYTVNYNNDCARRFPNACIKDNLGDGSSGRYHFTCPNQIDALRFYQTQIREIMSYDIDGLFIDMTFWPSICFCDACREKYGRPFPDVIDWQSPEWVGFQRFRERSMAEFAEKLTQTAREARPEAAVVHQFSPVLHGWFLGQSKGIADASDYASGDFYGGKLQQRLAVKAFDAFTQNPPFEFMTSRCVNLRDHTSNKDPQELLLSALTTLANGGAYLFIDAINPDGTLRESVYQTFHNLNHTLEPFRNAVAQKQFRLTAKTALYFSISCCVNQMLNGMKLREFDGGGANNMDIRRNAVLDEVLGSAEILTQMHIPYRVITQMESLEQFTTMIVNNAAFLSADDCERLRSFVKNGGTLIATGMTSLQDMNGRSSGNFQLSDVFGVDYCGMADNRISYLGDEEIIAKIPAVVVKEHADTEVEMSLKYPDFPYQDPERYASIHSDPPGNRTPRTPGLCRHRYGRGLCIYLASPLLELRQYTQQQFGRRLFASAVPEFLTEAVNLPPSTEVTLLEADGEHLLCIVNMQDELPAIPLHDVRISFHAPTGVKEVVRVSDGQRVAFTENDGIVTLDIPLVTIGEFYILK